MAGVDDDRDLESVALVREAGGACAGDCHTGRQRRCEVVDCLYIVCEPQEFGLPQDGALLLRVGDDRECRALWIVVAWDRVCGDASVVHADEPFFGVIVDGIHDGASFGFGGSLDVLAHVVDVSWTVFHKECEDQVAGPAAASDVPNTEGGFPFAEAERG